MLSGLVAGGAGGVLGVAGAAAARGGGGCWAACWGSGNPHGLTGGGAVAPDRGLG